MHKFLRAIGFSQFDTRKKIQSLVRASVLNSSEKFFTTNGDETMLAEYCKDFSSSLCENNFNSKTESDENYKKIKNSKSDFYQFGIAICGELSEDDSKFSYDYYYPYLRTNKVSSCEDINIERHGGKESYAGICDDIRVGISLIFYLQNMIDYVKIKNNNRLPIRGTSLCLSALSVEGTIMMPIIKSEKQKEIIKRKTNNRCRLIKAAREGDEKAIESLTLDDMDTYSSISRKIRNEDVFTLVDSYFMPYGVECDQYSILGEIIECEKVKNELTQESVYVMNINCNELCFDLCINEKDLYGEPEVGRRFKGSVWLQGYINFPE